MSKIIYLDEVDSTNLSLSELTSREQLEDGATVVAVNQTKGKGQAGNSWESESGKNLTFSILFCPEDIQVCEQFAISKAVTLGIADALEELVNDITIKWPNDIYWQDKKIAGILIENTVANNRIKHCIAGIGININQEKFLSDAPNPVSLKQITGLDYSLQDVLTSVRSSIFERYTQLLTNDTDIYTDYFNKLYHRNGFYLYRAGNEVFEAKIKCVKLSGHLVLETKQGEEFVFAFKEVTAV